MLRVSPIARDLLRDVGAPAGVEALQPLRSRYLTDAADEVRVHARHYPCHDKGARGDDEEYINHAQQFLITTYDDDYDGKGDYDTDDRSHVGLRYEERRSS